MAAAVAELAVAVVAVEDTLWIANVGIFVELANPNWESLDRIADFDLYWAWRIEIGRAFAVAELLVGNFRLPAGRVAFVGIEAATGVQWAVVAGILPPAREYTE